MKMVEKKLSVIVPIYNLKEYLRQCLDSLVSQTYSNLEIILIDDGSTDGSTEIVRAYECKYKNIKAVYQDNHGESHARNVGLRMATGDYITICDCDDWAEPDMYESLMAITNEKEPDIVAGGFYHIENDIDIPIKNIKPIKSDSINREEFFAYLYERDNYMAFAYMWSKVFKREMFFGIPGIDEGEILFDENLEFGGDSLALCKIGVRARSTYYLDRPLYHYRQRNDSGSHAPNLKKRLDWVSAYKRMVEVFKEAKINEKSQKYLIRFLSYICATTAEIAYEQGNVKALKEVQECMKENADIYFEMNSEHPERKDWYLERLNYKL